MTELTEASEALLDDLTTNSPAPGALVREKVLTRLAAIEAQAVERARPEIEKAIMDWQQNDDNRAEHDVRIAAEAVAEMRKALLDFADGVENEQQRKMLRALGQIADKPAAVTERKENEDG